MPCANATLDVRTCGLGDVSRLSRLLKASWHATYDSILGEGVARRRGRIVYSAVNLAIWIIRSRWSSHASRMVIATRGDTAVGVAMAGVEASEIVLHMLYVAPERKGQGIGSALLQAAIGSHAGAKSIRVEVLKDNVAAIAWYKAQAFETYGESRNAIGIPGVAAVYMDKKLDRLRPGEPPC